MSSSGLTERLADAGIDANAEPIAAHMLHDKKMDAGTLPFLADAFRRLLEEYPSTANGLSRTERQALEVLLGGPRTLAELYPAAHHQVEPVVWMGDWSFVEVVLALAAAKTPLLAFDGPLPEEEGDGYEKTMRERVSITDAGRQVLEPQPVDVSSFLGAVDLNNLKLLGLMNDLTTALVMTLTRPQRSAAGADAGAACDRRLLWRFGISGDRPIVLSYASSPPFTIPEGGEEPTTSALLDTCFRQVEYAGVLEGADNPAGAEALVDWMLSDEVQSALPESMYVFPVMPGAGVPADWAEFAPQPTELAWRSQPGVAAWSLELAPAASTRVTARYVISHPKDARLSHE